MKTALNDPKHELCPTFEKYSRNGYKIQIMVHCEIFKFLGSSNPEITSFMSPIGITLYCATSPRGRELWPTLSTISLNAITGPQTLHFDENQMFLRLLSYEKSRFKIFQCQHGCAAVCSECIGIIPGF